MFGEKYEKIKKGLHLITKKIEFYFKFLSNTPKNKV